MSYCPECGEKVANSDVFCPYCGISLRPIVPVDDASMSETIVGMPPPVFEPAPPQNERNPVISPNVAPPNVPVIENNQSPGNAAGYSSGDTAENWAMKTESVEIPAAQLESLPEIAQPELPTEPSSRQAPDNVIPTPPTPFAIEPPEASTPVNFERETVEPPTPAIIEEQSIEATPVENGVEEVADLPPTEPEKIADSSDNLTAKSEDSAPTGEKYDEQEFSAERQDSFDALPTEISTDYAETNLSTEKSQESNEILPEPEFDAPRPPVNDWDDEPLEKPQQALTDVPGAPSDLPIAAPEKPLVLENQEDLSRFDSVQIIQKKEIQEEQLKAAAMEPKPIIEPTPVAEPQSESKDARSYTTPNIGNTDTDGRKSAKLQPLEEGTILNGRYEIVRKIGGGGMGAVYLANDRNLGGVLRAVKEMVQSYIESEQQDKAINDFKRESLLLTSLDHPAIPTIYDYFFDEKEARFYLVMKYISGGDLASRLRAAPEGRIDEKSVTEWAIQIADVLHYLHNHEPSIVYRDLKPANVMIDGNTGRVMLIDFGIARWVNKEEKGVTAVGTMGYAPPELFSGNVEPRSDIYSLGSTMFHLLTGADPQSNPLLIFDFQKHPRPRQINSQLSDQIEQILMRSVEYNAEARFRSAAEMRDALKEHHNNLLMGKVTYGVKVAPSNRAFSEQAVFCGFCGKQIVATDVFCAFCGAQQPIAQPGVSQSSVAVQPLTAKLVILGTGELEPSSFRLEKSDNLLGRRDPMSNIFPEVDLSKYDPQTKISRRHARIWREGNSFLVEDLGSSNGTTLLPSVNDSVRLLPHQPHTLTNGDKIKLGDTTLHFTIG